jgi:hypothetical protein
MSILEPSPKHTSIINVKEKEEKQKTCVKLLY